MTVMALPLTESFGIPERDRTASLALVAVLPALAGRLSVPAVPVWGGGHANCSVLCLLTLDIVVTAVDQVCADRPEFVADVCSRCR